MNNTSESEYIDWINNIAALNPENRLDAICISETMKELGVTPYIFIHHSLRELLKGDYRNASKLIEFAGDTGNFFYPANSLQSFNFSETIILLRYLILHLADEFRDIAADDCNRE